MKQHHPHYGASDSTDMEPELGHNPTGDPSTLGAESLPRSRLRAASNLLGLGGGNAEARQSQGPVCSTDPASGTRHGGSPQQQPGGEHRTGAPSGEERQDPAMPGGYRRAAQAPGVGGPRAAGESREGAPGGG